MADFVDTMTGLVTVGLGAGIVMKVTDAAFGPTKATPRKSKSKSKKSALKGPSSHQKMYNSVFGK